MSSNTMKRHNQEFHETMAIMLRLRDHQIKSDDTFGTPERLEAIKEEIRLHKEIVEYHTRKYQALESVIMFKYGRNKL